MEKLSPAVFLHMKESGKTRHWRFFWILRNKKRCKSKYLDLHRFGHSITDIIAHYFLRSQMFFEITNYNYKLQMHLFNFAGVFPVLIISIFIISDTDQQNIPPVSQERIRIAFLFHLVNGAFC